MSSKHWMPLFIGDYLKDTRMLSQGQHGAYLLLICHYWESRKPIPDNQSQLIRIGLAFTEEEQANIDFVLETFFEKTQFGYVHKKLDALIESHAEKAMKSRQNGAKGGRPVHPEKPRNNPEITQQVFKTKPKPNPEITQSITIPDPEPEYKRSPCASTEVDAEEVFENSQEIILENIQPSPPEKPAKYSPEAKALAVTLKQALSERGQDVFARDWHLGTLASIESLLKQGKSSDEISDCIVWAVNEWSCKSSVTHGKHLLKAWGHWRATIAESKAKNPPKTKTHQDQILEAIQAGEPIADIFHKIIIPAGAFTKLDLVPGKKIQNLTVEEMGQDLEMSILRVYDKSQHSHFEWLMAS
jgi:uncharacterized protein YdaU (DUF1376 family)